VKLAAWKIKKPEHPLVDVGPLNSPSELFYRSIHSIFRHFHAEINRTGSGTSHLVQLAFYMRAYPVCQRAIGLLSSRQANVQPNEDSICISNVKHKPRNSLLALWKSRSNPGANRIRASASDEDLARCGSHVQVAIWKQPRQNLY